MSDQPYSPPAGVVLAATHADPDDVMLAQALRVLPRLQELYAAIVLVVAPDTGRRTVETLRGRGVEVVERAEPGSIKTLGLVRHATLRAGLERGSSHLHYCDWDRAIHWAELYPDELRDVVGAITRHDFLILGRTPRAFATHPRQQRDTEALINHVFGLAFGQDLDVTAASRGLSRRAAEALLALRAPEPSLGNDCAWPLVLARQPELVIGYARTDGLEWETPDRYGDEIALAGGLDAWIANFDAAPGRWEFRTRLALLEIEAINRWRAT